MILIIFLILIILLTVYINKNSVREGMCDIEYPVCDNACQRAKLDLCITIKRSGGKLPYHC